MKFVKQSEQLKKKFRQMPPLKNSLSFRSEIYIYQGISSLYRRALE